MPGDLQDPTQMFPFHNNKVYEPGGNTFESGSPVPELNRMLQNLAGTSIGRRLSQSELEAFKNSLETTGHLHRQWGDESVQNEIIRLVKSISQSKKVAAQWLNLTSF